MGRSLIFVDACAIITLLSDEAEAQRISNSIASAKAPFSSPIATLEAPFGLARPDKFDLPLDAVEALLPELFEERGIEVRDLPPARETTRLALSAAHRYRAGRQGLNLGDCFHYACAKFYDVPIIATDAEYRQTDLETVP